MKKFFILIGVIFISLPSFANDLSFLSILDQNGVNLLDERTSNDDDHGPLSTDQGTFFERLRAYYDQATEPTVEDLSGWYTGRCYQVSDQNRSLSQLLVGESREIPQNPQDHGPLFPPTTEFKIMLIIYPSQPANFYDNLTDEIVQEVQSLIENNLSKITVATHVDGALASQYSEGDLEYRIRKSGNFLFSKLVLLRDISNYKAGDTAFFCYYFKKVR